MSTCRSVSSSSPAPFRSGIGGISTGLASRSSLQLGPPWGFGPKTISAFLATPLDPGQIRPEFAAIRRDAWPCLDRGKTIQNACEACASSTLHAAHLESSSPTILPFRPQRRLPLPTPLAGGAVLPGERSAASRRAASGRGRPRLLSEKKRALSEARRAPISGRLRLDYHSDRGQILYRTAKGIPQSLDALDWIARVCSHIPDRNEHQVRYYGRYASASRGKRRQQERASHCLGAEEPPAEEESAAERFSRRRRRSWARLLRKIYEVDPLRCSCGGSLSIIAVLEQPPVIRQILAHLKRGQRAHRAPPPRLFPQKQERFLAQLSPRQAQAVRVWTRFRTGPTEELELFSWLPVSLCPFFARHRCLATSSLPLPPPSHNLDPLASHRSPNPPHLSPISVSLVVSSLFLGLHQKGNSY